MVVPSPEELKIERRYLNWRQMLKPISERDFKDGFWHYWALKKHIEPLGIPYAREIKPTDKDWQLPPNWKEIFLQNFADLLKKNRTFKVFMDICVRCGACTDKCHYYIGTGDPKNMPVARAELLRSIYRRYFTKTGRIFGELAGARELTENVIKELYYYFYQCSLCRRCSAFCPYGIDTAEIVWWGRRLLNSLGVIHRFTPISIEASARSGNHLGLAPIGVADALKSVAEDVAEVTGIEIEVPINKKGAEILFIAPSADFFATPHWYVCMGYLMLFHEIDLDYTWTTYASEGGNFGFFQSYELAQKLNAKIYQEAERLGVKWILGGECGHMWRDKHQCMATMHEIPKNLEEPVSPITGTHFDYAASTKMVHISEFVADLIHHNKIKLDKSRNDKWKVTLHDGCNYARGMGFLEEPRYVLRSVCNYFYEMPEHTIREKTYCCGSGGGLLAEEVMELRMRGGMPRAMALRYVHQKYGVNLLVTLCAMDKAAFPALLKYWKLDVEVGGSMELLGNALIMKGEKERTLDLRGEPLFPEVEEVEEVKVPEVAKEYKCTLCDATFGSFDECAEHAEEAHRIAKAMADMCCKEV
jgi:Fe-S oxidoreductase